MLKRRDVAPKSGLRLGDALVDQFLNFEFALEELLPNFFEGFGDLGQLPPLVVFHVLQFQTGVSQQVLVSTELCLYVTKTARERSLYLNGCFVVSAYEIVFRMQHHTFTAQWFEVVPAVKSDRLLRMQLAILAEFSPLVILIFSRFARLCLHALLKLALCHYLGWSLAPLALMKIAIFIF